jgi:hypothetical protein
MIRTERDECLLCKNAKAIRTNSHIVPSALLKNVIGERNKERSFLFYSNQNKVNEYFGRSFIQNKSIEKEKPNFTYDHVLCDDCENYFGRLENIVSPILTNLDVEINPDKILKIDLKDSQLRIIQNLNGGIVQLFFYSIIWRLIIQDYLDNGTISKPIIKTEQNINEILNNFSNFNQKQLKKINIYNNLKLLVFTTDGKEFSISQLYNIYSENPFFFIAGRYILLLFDSNLELTVESNFIYNNAKQIINNGEDKFKISFIPLDIYDNLIMKLFNKFCEHFTLNNLEKLKSDLDEKINI